MVKYGWTVCKIISLSNESILFSGGEYDGLSVGINGIPRYENNVELGDVFSLNIQPYENFAFGQIKKAVLLWRESGHENRSDSKRI